VNTIVGAGRADLCILDLPPAAIERPLPGVPTPARDSVRA
jgi:hypothetical protein